MLGTTLASTPSLNCQLRKWKEHLWEKQQNGGWADRARPLARMAEGLSASSALQPPGVGREEEVLLSRAGADCPKLVTILAASVLLWG